MAAPRIGISINFSYPKPGRALYLGKTLQYVEEALLLGMTAAGAVPVVLPDLSPLGDGAGEPAAALLDLVDGLLFSGGADVAPGSYGEEPIEGRWPGDPRRDAYELALFSAARARGLPILGICRGAQLINVAMGGSLYQDIETQEPAAAPHRDAERYDALGHAVTLAEGSWVRELYGQERIEVNSVHHQAARRVGDGLRITAQAPDGIAECVERVDGREWIVGIQWHPEWITGAERAEGTRVFGAFLDVVRRRRRAP